MSYHIIKQPNGKLALFSNHSNRIVMHNCDPEDIIFAFAQGDIQAQRANVLGVVEKLEKGQKPYAQFTKTWEQAIRQMRAQHGAGSVHRLLFDISQEDAEAARTQDDGDSIPNVFALLVSGALTVEEAQGILTDYINRILGARTERVAQMVEDAGIYDVANTETLAAQVRSLESPVTKALFQIGVK